MNTPELVMSDRIHFNKQLRETETASLPDRQAARAEWLDSLQNDPKTIANRIGWLLDGSYGYGSYQAAHEVIRNKRMNRSAWLGQVIAALEWGCPSNFAREAWNKLTAAQQETLNKLIAAEIESALEVE